MAGRILLDKGKMIIYVELDLVSKKLKKSKP